MPGRAGPLRRWEWAALVAALLLAMAVRLGATGITEFKRDEANLSQRALDLARGRDLPLLGISSSVGVPNPPHSVYLLAPPYALSDNPALATLYIGLLNVIAVALAWALARRYYGPVAGAVAGLLYAASPWAALYSRKIWAQNMLPPLVVATVFSGLLGYGEGKRWARWGHWPLLAVTVQVHYGAVSLVPLSLLMLVLWWRQTNRRVHWRDLVVGLALAALTVLPALAGAYRDDWLSLDTLRDALDSNPDHSPALTTTALDFAWFTVAGTDIHSLAGPEQFRAYLDSVPDVYPLFKLVPLGAVLAVGWLLLRTLRRHPSRGLPDVVLIAWLVLPVLLFTWEWTEVAPHYMIPLMPAAYVLCGAGVAALAQAVGSQRVQRAVLAGSGALFVVIAGLQVVLFAQLLAFLDDHATLDGFGTPLHYLLDARAAVLARDPADVLVISDQEQAPFDEVPAVWGVLLDSVPSVRFVDGRRTVVLPADAAWAVVVPPPDGWSDAAPVESGDPGQGETVARRPGEPPITLRPVTEPEWLADVVAVGPVRFANGAALTGYAVREESVLIVWELGGPVAADYQAFIHALDAGGERLEQRDRPAWPGRYWRAGDRLALWFDVTLPPGTAALYAGLYTTDGVTFLNVPVVDATGAYLAQGATITLSE